MKCKLGFVIFASLTSKIKTPKLVVRQPIMTSVVPTSQTKKTIYCGGLAEEVDEKVNIIQNIFGKNVLDIFLLMKWEN